jgi:hypothetical protein
LQPLWLRTRAPRQRADVCVGNGQALVSSKPSSSLARALSARFDLRKKTIVLDFGAKASSFFFSFLRDVHFKMQVRLCRDLKNGDLVALKVSGAKLSHVRRETIQQFSR